MFSSGTKIILIESSLHKTIGPRKGSIGYISNCFDTRTFSLTTEDHESFNVVASLCEIIFIRFGFEENGRMERKTVISVVPILKNEAPSKKEINIEKNIDSNASKYINRLCRILSSSKSSYLSDNIKSSYEVSSSTPIVLASTLSYDITDLTTCDKIEFMAWATAHLSNSSMMKFIDRTIHSGHFNKYNDIDLNSSQTWGDLYQLTRERSHRTTYITNSSETQETRKKCIILIRKITSVYAHSYMKKAIRSINNIQFMDTNECVFTIYDTIGKYLYNKVVVSLLGEICRNFHVPEITDAIEDLEMMMLECTSLSDKMLKSNSGFGYMLLP